MNNRQSQGCVKLYAVTFFALILLHAAIAIGFLFYENSTVQILQDLNSHGDNDKIRNYLDDHRYDFKVVSVVVLSIEFITFVIAVFASRSVSGALDEEMMMD